MGDIFGGAGRVLAQGVKGAIGGIRKVVGRGGGGKADQSNDNVINDSKRSPKKHKLKKDIEVDRTPDPEGGGGVVDPQDLVNYENFLGGVVGADQKGLSKCLSDLSAANPHRLDVQPHLVEMVEQHVTGAIDILPKAFGLNNQEIRTWLLKSEPGKTAADLKEFITTRLAENGHGKDAANWLYEQILAAGSTCLAAQALESGNVERCKAYLDRTINEINLLRREFNSEESVNRLIARWNSNADAQWDEERFESIKKQVQKKPEIARRDVEEEISRKSEESGEDTGSHGSPGSGSEDLSSKTDNPRIFNEKTEEK